jgi:DivIVA domain-containing protein
MSSEQIRTKPFLTERKGGYNKDEVVAFLEEVADEFEALQSRSDAAQASSDPAAVAELEELRARAASHEGLQDALEKAYADVEQLRAEVARAREERDSLSQKLASSTDPTAAIGEEVAMVLRSAKEAANELHARAERESNELRAAAESTRSDAERAAAQLRSDAERQAGDIVAQAHREAEELLAREMARYEELLSAQSEVTERLAQAESVVRSVRDRLSAPAPVDPATFSPSSSFAPEATSAPSSTEDTSGGGFGASASDWFSEPKASSDDTPSDEVQEFAG